MEKKTIAIFCGGNSLEHQVSLISAYSLIQECLKIKEYQFVLIGIPKKKELDWIIEKAENYYTFIIKNLDTSELELNLDCNKINYIKNGFINNYKIDNSILTTHGQNGEDGVIQGFLEICNINYLGCKVNQSSICFNKLQTKIIANFLNIPIVPFKIIQRANYQKNDLIMNNLSDQLVVKINNGGSSIGCYLSSKKDINYNLNKAFKLSDTVLIEQYIENKELSIGIIKKNNKLIKSQIGQYVIDESTKVFDYDQKYNHKPEFTYLNIPAKINKDVEDLLIDYTFKLFNYLDLNDYARFDFFLTPKNEIYLNEINTLPGMTKDSTFPLLFSNLYNFQELIEFLLE